MDCSRLTKLLLALLFIPAHGTRGHAQNVPPPVIISVRNTAGDPVPEVEIFVAETGNLYDADREGDLALPRSAAPRSLTIFAPGYTTENRWLAANFSGPLRVTMTALTRELTAVTVVAETEKRFAVGRLRAVEGTAVYAGKKTEVVALDALTANKATNLARQIYGQVTGLNIYENDDAGLQLNIGGRGLDPNRSASFNTRQNGYDISADVLGYPESYYSPPAEALASIQVVRGAASLQYGTQFGGLVNFVFHRPDREQKFSGVSRQTYGSNQLFTSFNALSGTVGKLGYYAFYNYKRGDGFRPNSGFASHNAHLHLDYNFREGSRLSLEYTYLSYLAQQAGGLTDAQFATDPLQSNRTRNWFSVDWELWNLRWDHKINRHTNLSLSVFGLDAARDAVGFRTNRVSQVDDLEAPRDLLRNTFNNWGGEARVLRRYEIAGRRAVGLLGTKLYRAENTALQGPGTAGADADFSLATARFPSYPSQSAFDFPNRNLAVFTEQIFYLNDRLSFTPGARYEYIRTASEGTFRRIDFDLAGNPIRDEVFADDRLFERSLLLLGVGISYRHRTHFEAYANFSQNYRSVTFNDIRTVNPSFQVDPDISDEDGYTLDAGARGVWNNLSYAINGFGLRYNNRLGEVLTPETRVNADGQEVRTGRIVRRRGNIGAAYIYGLESLLAYDFARRETEGDTPFFLTGFSNLAITGSRYLTSELAGVEGNEVEFIPRLNWKAGLRFGYGNVLGSVQYSYLSEQFTDASNAPRDERDNQSGIVGSIPAYGVVDLSLSYRWRALRLESGINNLLDESYFTRRATGYPGPGIIPSAPRTGYVTVGMVF